MGKMFRIHFGMSDAYLREQLRLTGIEEPKSRDELFDLADLDQEWRDKILALTGKYSVLIRNEFTLMESFSPHAKIDIQNYVYGDIDKKKLEFDHVPGNAELLDALLETARKAQIAETEFNEIRVVLQAEADARQAREDDSAGRRAAEKALEKALKLEARRAWVEEFGSPFLKEAIAHGYNCSRRYQEERAQREYPDFEIDFDDSADWDVRGEPSEEALKLEMQYETCPAVKSVQIVWLTGWDYGLRPREALVVDDVNYSHKLILAL